MGVESNILSYLNKYQSGFKTGVLYKDFVEIIGQKAASLTFGQDLIFNGKNEATKILNKWYIKNDISNKLRKSEYMCSTWGKSILFLQIVNNGQDLTLSYVKNLLQGRVGSINDEAQVADIWNQDYVGDSPYFTHVRYTTIEITIEFYGTNNNKLRVGTSETEISPELIPLKSYSYPNKLGMIPVVEIENLPVNNLYNSTYGNFRPDWLPVMKLIELYNEIVRVSQVELTANRTRLIGELPPSEILKLNNGNSGQGFIDLFKDAFINARFNVGYSSGIGDAGLTIMQGDPKLQTYSDYENFMDQKIMNGMGYSTDNIGGSETYQNKTASLFADKRDKETTDYKQALRRPKLYKIFDYVLKFYGVEPFDNDGQRIYSFDFNNLAISDTAKKIQQNTELLENGIISQIEYRASVFNEPLDVAETNIKKVRKQYLEYQAQEQELLNTQNGDNDGDSSERDYERYLEGKRKQYQIDSDEGLGDI